MALAAFIGGGLVGMLIMGLLSGAGREDAVIDAHHQGYQAGFRAGRSALRQLQESIGAVLDGDPDSELGIHPK